MCGHVGVAAKLITDQLKNAFTDLLYVDVLRGEDSTGVAAISSAWGGNPDIEVFKEVGSPSDLFLVHGKGSRGRSLTFKPVSVYLGHNRAATQGKVNAESAHPFEFENVVGAHNGTVAKWNLRDFHGYKDFEIDSQIIYSHLSHTNSIDQTWAGIDGAAALVWWDKGEKRLNMIRNSQRPLWVVYTEDDKAVLWASEPWMVQVAAIRRGLKLRDPFEIKVDTLYTFHCVTEAGDDQDKMRHVERAVAPFVPKPVTTYYGNQHYPFRGRNGSGYESENYDDWMPGTGGYGRHNQPPSNSAEGEANKNPTEMFHVVITEFHNQKLLPRAFGHTASGKDVMINIPPARIEDAKKSILGRGKTGYWVTKNAFRRSVGQPGMLWCNFGELTFAKLKPHFYLAIDNDGGSWEIRGKSTENPTPENSSLVAPYINGQWISKATYLGLMECGCCSCNRVATWEDRAAVAWLDDEFYYCPECLGIPWVQESLQLTKKLA